MITNQILTRQMGAYKVEQRTKDGMFNATSLLRQWNETMGTNKRMQDFFDNDSTKEFIKVLGEKENLQISDNAKKRDVKFAYQTTKGVYGGTWLHPFLFVKFGMWISAEFEYNIVKLGAQYAFNEVVHWLQRPLPNTKRKENN